MRLLGQIRFYKVRLGEVRLNEVLLIHRNMYLQRHTMYFHTQMNNIHTYTQTCTLAHSKYTHKTNTQSDLYENKCTMETCKTNKNTNTDSHTHKYIHNIHITQAHNIYTYINIINTYLSLRLQIQTTYNNTCKGTITNPRQTNNRHNKP